MNTAEKPPYTCTLCGSIVFSEAFAYMVSERNIALEDSKRMRDFAEGILSLVRHWESRDRIGKDDAKILRDRARKALGCDDV